jgi:hypothetical protein
LDRRPNNLPLQQTALIGRERELAQVEALVRRPVDQTIAYALEGTAPVSGTTGDDAKPYQEKRVRATLEKLHSARRRRP